VQWLVLSKDERYILSSSIHLRLWDRETGKCLQAFEGHTETVRTVQFSGDERRILSASHDRTVRVWDVQSGRCLHILKGHPGLLVNATWSSDESQIISIDEEAQVRVWQ
jgi:WD40 repeat protein